MCSWKIVLGASAARAAAREAGTTRAARQAQGDLRNDDGPKREPCGGVLREVLVHVQHRLLLGEALGVRHERDEVGQELIDVMRLELRRAVEALHARRGLERHRHVVVAGVLELRAEAGEGHGRLARSTLADEEHAAGARPDRSSVNLEVAAGAEPPEEDLPDGRRLVPVRLLEGVGHPVPRLRRLASRGC